jgi:hypothetical protein
LAWPAETARSVPTCPKLNIAGFASEAFRPILSIRPRAHRPAVMLANARSLHRTAQLIPASLLTSEIASTLAHVSKIQSKLQAR